MEAADIVLDMLKPNLKRQFLVESLLRAHHQPQDGSASVEFRNNYEKLSQKVISIGLSIFD